MNNPRHIQVPPQAGRQLPSDWARNAAERRRQADSHYLNRLENAWRGDLTSTNTGATYGARLRSDRLDGLVLTEDNSDEEIWESAGIRVVRKKK